MMELMIIKILNYFKLIDNRIIIIYQINKGINSVTNSGLKIAKGLIYFIF